MQILGLGLVKEALRELGALLCKAIYWLISLLYELFDTISRANILNSSEIEPLYQRVTLVLTIVMVFYITFEFVKYVVQPDTINDKEKGAGNLALRIVVVILLIAFVPTIFDLSYKLQGRLLDSQIFSKVILGKENINMTNFGKSLSATMFGVFYDVNEEACDTYETDKENCAAAPLVNFNLGWLAEQGNLKYLSIGLNDSVSKKYNINGTSKSEDVPIIKFDGIQAIVVGGLIVYILVLYCIDLGTRYAQLVFLQIMSPIAIMGYLSPKKDNMFSKWLKQCITTYLDLFIRLFIIYFVLLICDVLQTAYKGDKLFSNINASTGTKAFAYVAIVLGLLVFASKAPKMLKELLPNMSGAAGIGFGLGAKDRFEPTTKTISGTARAVGRTAAVTAVAPRAIGGAIQNKTGVWSALKAMGKGYKNAFGKNGGYRKSGQAIRGSIQKDMDVIEAGGIPIASDLFGGPAAYRSKREDVEVAQYKAGKKNKDDIRNAADEYKDVKRLKTAWESAKQGGLSQSEIDEAYSKYKSARDAVIKANANGPAAAGTYNYVYTDASGIKQVKAITIETDEVAKFSNRVNNNIVASRASMKGTALEKMVIEVKALDPDTGAPILDANGNNIVEKKTVGELNKFEYAASIGDIADFAETEVIRIQNEKGYKRDHANADKSKE